MKMVFIRTERVHVYSNGLVGIEIPSTPLTVEQNLVIKTLFPNLQEKVYDLLDKEALFGATDDIVADFDKDVRHDIYETSKSSVMKLGKKRPDRNLDPVDESYLDGDDS